MNNLTAFPDSRSGLKFPEMSPQTEHRKQPTTSGRLFHATDVKGGRFAENFEEIQIMGTGEFSEVYEVADRKTRVRYAVKRTRYPMMGPKERYAFLMIR